MMEALKQKVYELQTLLRVLIMLGLDEEDILCVADLIRKHSLANAGDPLPLIGSVLQKVEKDQPEE